MSFLEKIFILMIALGVGDLMKPSHGDPHILLPRMISIAIGSLVYEFFRFRRTRKA